MSSLLYGSECWTMTDALHRKLAKFFNGSVRKLCNRNWLHSTRCQKITSSELQQRLGIDSFDDYYVRRFLGWAGYISRMPMQRVPRKCLYLEAFSQAVYVRGGRNASWYQTVKRGLKAIGIDHEVWMKVAEDPAEWAKVIHTVKHKFYSSSQPVRPPVLPPSAPPVLPRYHPIAPTPLLPRHQQLNPRAVPFDIYQLHYQRLAARNARSHDGLNHPFSN